MDPDFYSRGRLVPRAGFALVQLSRNCATRSLISRRCNHAVAFRFGRNHRLGLLAFGFGCITATHPRDSRGRDSSSTIALRFYRDRNVLVLPSTSRSCRTVRVATCASALVQATSCALATSLPVRAASMKVGRIESAIRASARASSRCTRADRRLARELQPPQPAHILGRTVARGIHPQPGRAHAAGRAEPTPPTRAIRGNPLTPRLS